MGIKNLTKFIQKYAPSAISYTNIKKYKNSVIGIDANLMIYKLIYGIRTNGYDLMNQDVIITHIYTLLMKIYAFRKYNINPIFVFDSGSPKIKLKTLEIREKTRKKLAEKYKKSKSKKGKRIYFYTKSDISDREINDCKELLEIFNYTIIDAKEEADSELAELYKKKIIQYIASDDMDILLFGGGVLLKNFSVSENRLIQEINLQKILDELSITQKQLIQIGVLLGSDYSYNKTYSISKTYELIKTHKKIEKFPKSILSELKGYEDAVNYFINPPTSEINKIKKNGDYSMISLRLFLKKFKFKSSTIEKIIDKL